MNEKCENTEHSPTLLQFSCCTFWQTTKAERLTNIILYVKAVPHSLSGGILVSRDETLLQVKRAEEEAEQIIKEARESQRAAVVAARKQAMRVMQEADEKLRAEFDSAVSKERMKVASQRETILSRGRDEALRMKVQAKIGRTR